MKRAILSIMLVLLACTWASAESLVWKAQKNGAVLYLGGTFHLLRETDFPLPPEFDKAYKASDMVIFETDIGKFQDTATQRKMLAKTVYADGSTIDQHLSAKTYAELSEYCASNGIPLQVFNQFKPSMLITTLVVMELMKLGVTQHGVDSLFYEQAKTDRKTVKALETVDEQINYITSMADGAEDEFVTYSIRDLKKVKHYFEDLEAAWRKGDAGKLNQLMNVDLKTRQPKLYKKLITGRNNSWLRWIEANQKSPQTKLMLVGAAHLVGPDGLIESLKKKGYKVDKL